MRLISLLLALTVSCGLAAQTPSWSRPSGRDRGLTGQEAVSAIKSAQQRAAKAANLLQRALPVYGGRRTHAQHVLRICATELQAALLPRTSATEARVKSRRPYTVDDQLRRIPASKEKSRRDYESDDLRQSDTVMNAAGWELLQAQRELDRVPTGKNERLREAKRTVAMALSDVRGAIGTIRDPLKR